MNETPITPEDPDIPDSMPTGPDGGTVEVQDFEEPLGVQPDAEPGAPGLPEREPPQDA